MSASALRRRLRVAQPALSRIVQDAEAILGFPLFEALELDVILVRAARGLLAKVLPDLQTIDLAATVTVRKVVRDEPLSVEEFQRLYCEPPTIDLKPN